MEQVTVDKKYFETLLRRADFHADDGTPRERLVTVKQSDYDALLRTSQDLETLKQALYSGGVSEDTLKLLLGGNPDDNTHESTVGPYDSSSLTTRRGHIADDARHDASSTMDSLPLPRSRRRGYDRKPSYDISTMEDYDGYGSDNETDARRDSIDVEEPVWRTLFFSSLPERTTYLDLCSVIRGGTLVSIHLRHDRRSGQSDQTATVTFLDGAAEFLAWVKRNDLYLHSKRIDVKWADRQFRLNEHIYSKMQIGATRNLLIGNAASRGLTAQQIRQDMEHIDKLFIIDTAFHNGHAYVRTNSVCNAMYARTCMLSRSTYKGCKIEFMPDECAGPLPRRGPTRNLSAPKEIERKVTPLSNRFDLLNLDGNDDVEA